MSQFDAINERAGVKLDNGFFHGMITINTLDDFRALFANGITNAQIEEQQSLSQTNPNFNHTDDEEKILNDLIASVYADQNIELPLTQSFIENTFPIEVELLSANDVVISTDQVTGPNASPLLINADNLTFDGGSLTVITTVLTLSANNLIFKQSSTPSKNQYHIGIFGEKGQDGTAGANGQNFSTPAQAGDTSNPPAPGFCAGAGNGKNGSAGNTGDNGRNGENGMEGDANLPANITINAVDDDLSQLVIFTQSGEGGAGGNGGNGGKGQQGGAGGHGCNSGCEGTDGGNGGNGGDGGNGGNGGNGGSGKNGNSLFINFPQQNKDILKVITRSAKAGNGGKGGLSGQGGNGGTGGGGGKHKTNGTNGSQGKFGVAGKAGNTGLTDGAPGNVIYNFN